MGKDSPGQVSTPGSRRSVRAVIIGSGNVATQLAPELQRAEVAIVQVYSRTREHAEALAALLGCEATDQLSEVKRGCDLYLFALKDDALAQVIAAMPATGGLWLHTAGSMPMSLFEGATERYGVFYPLQTFSKGRRVEFNDVPFFLEANSDRDLILLKQLAERISDRIYFLPSEKRKYLHLAAVFACNFTNHLFAMAEKVLEEQGIPLAVMMPLIQETVDKIYTLSPREAQTGPAVRYDEEVMNRHLAMLGDAEQREIYRLLSKHIHKAAIHE